MKSNILTALMCLSLLSGCIITPKPEAPPPVIKTQYIAIKPDKAYYVCDKVILPDPDTLTDIQIAKLINDLVRANKICSNNMNAIQHYIDNAEQVIRARNN